MPGRASTSTPRSRSEAMEIEARSRSGSLVALRPSAWPSSHPGSSVSYGTPAIWASISASRWRSKANVSRYNGSTTSRRDLVPPRGERRIVGRDLAQHVAQAHRVEQADRRAAADRRVRAGPRVAQRDDAGDDRVRRRRRSAGSGPRSWPSRRRRRSACRPTSGRPAGSWPRPAPTRRGGGRRASPDRTRWRRCRCPRCRCRPAAAAATSSRTRCSGGPSAAGSEPSVERKWRP